MDSANSEPDERKREDARRTTEPEHKDAARQELRREDRHDEERSGELGRDEERRSVDGKKSTRRAAAPRNVRSHDEETPETVAPKPRAAAPRKRAIAVPEDEPNVDQRTPSSDAALDSSPRALPRSGKARSSRSGNEAGPATTTRKMSTPARSAKSPARAKEDDAEQSAGRRARKEPTAEGVAPRLETRRKAPPSDAPETDRSDDPTIIEERGDSSLDVDSDRGRLPLRRKAGRNRPERKSRNRGSDERDTGEHKQDEHERDERERDEQDTDDRDADDEPDHLREEDASNVLILPTRGARRRADGPIPVVYRKAFPVEHLDDDAVKVLRRLHRSSFKAYLVGGCVRDLLLGKKPKDFDLATSARPHEVKALFRNCRVIGRRFRLAHILFGGGKIIETATFRRDPTVSNDEDTFASETEDAREAIDSGEFDTYLPSRHKPRDDHADILIRNDNAFGEPHEDALRRDFTINGLFYDVERGEVIDYVGGLVDIKRRAINTIGLPDVRFREDPVRILRAVKFSARLDLGIDPEVYDAMVAQREELRKAAKPRLLEEMLRLVRGGAGHRSIWLCWELGVLSVVLPELAIYLDDDGPRSRLVWGRLDAIDEAVRRGKAFSDPVLLAVLLMGPIEEAVAGANDPWRAFEELMADVTDSLAIPRRLKEQLRAILGAQRKLQSGRSQSIRRDVYADAMDLYELEQAARGLRLPEFRASAPTESEFEGALKRRRRRKPRGQ